MASLDPLHGRPQWLVLDDLALVDVRVLVEEREVKGAAVVDDLLRAMKLDLPGPVAFSDYSIDTAMLSLEEVGGSRPRGA